MVIVAYQVEQPIVNRKNRVRVPQSPHNWLIVQWIRTLRYERSDESSTLSKPTATAVWSNGLTQKSHKL